MDTKAADFLKKPPTARAGQPPGREQARILELAPVLSALLNRLPILSEEEVENQLRQRGLLYREWISRIESPPNFSRNAFANTGATTASPITEHAGTAQTSDRS